MESIRKFIAIRFTLYISLALLLGISSLFAVNKPEIIPVIFTPIYLLCCIRSYLIFKESITEKSRGQNLRRLNIQVILGMLPFLGYYLQFNWQEYSFLSVLTITWMMWEISKNETGRNEENNQVEIIAHYLAPAILFTVTIVLLSLIQETTDNLYGVEWTANNRYLVTVPTALTGALLYNPLRMKMEKLLFHLERRYVDNFTLKLNEWIEENNFSDCRKISEFIKNNTAGIDIQILFRVPFHKTFKPAEAREFPDNNPINLPKTLIREFNDTGFSHWTPVNIEKYYYDSPFYFKLLKTAEKSDILFTPLFNEQNSFPDVILIFTNNRDRLLSSGEKRKLLQFATAMKSQLLSLRRNSLPGKVHLPEEIHSISNIEELANKINEFLFKIIPLKNFSIILSKKDNSHYEILPVHSIKDQKLAHRLSEILTNLSASGMIQKTGNSAKDGDFLNFCMVNPSTGESFFKNSELKTKQFNEIFIPVLTEVIHSCGIYLEFDVEVIIPEKQLFSLIKDLTIEGGILLDRNIISLELGNQLDHVNQLTNQVKDTRLKMAGDLHDTVAQEMYAAKILLEMLEKQVKNSPINSTEDIKTLKTVVDEGLKRLRTMIVDLRNPNVSNKESSIDYLLNLAKRVESETGMKINFTGIELIEEIPVRESGEIKLIIAEGINNARKHSRATMMEIKLMKQEQGLYISIFDNGRGFVVNDSIKDGSFGLTGMKTRCDRLRGNLEIESTKDEGTMLKIYLFDILS